MRRRRAVISCSWSSVSKNCSMSAATPHRYPRRELLPHVVHGLARAGLGTEAEGRGSLEVRLEDRFYALAYALAARPGSRRASPVPRWTVPAFRVPYAGGFLTAAPLRVIPCGFPSSSPLPWPSP